VALTAAQLFARVAVTGAEASVAALKGVSGQVDRTHASLNQISHGTGQLATGLLRIGAIAGTAAIGGLVAAAKVGANFGDQLNVINTIAQKTPTELAGIGEGIRGLAKETGANLTDLTGAYYDLLSAGVKVTDAQNALNLSYKLSRGSLSTTGEAVDFLTTAINSYSLDAKGATRVSDEFAQAVADGKVKLSDIAATFADVAPLARQMGLETGEIAAAYGFLTAKGVPAAEVTTQMSRATLELLKPSQDLLDLQKKTGVNYSEMARTKGLVPTLEAMREAAAKAGIPFQNLFGRIEGFRFALATTGQNFAAFEAEQQRVTNSAGALEKQFSERQGGLAFSLGKIKAAAIDAAISLETGFGPALGRLADKAAAFVNAHGTDFVRVGQQIGEMIDRVTNADWDKIADNARPFVDILRTALDLISKIPPQISLAVVGLAGLNKLSGGLVGAGAGNIAGGLASGLSNILLSKLPKVGGILGAATAQRVFVVNFPPGFGGGPNIGDLAKDGGLARGLVAAFTAAGPAIVAGLGLGALIGAIGLLITQEKDFAQQVTRGEQATAAARGLNPANVQPVEAQTGGPHANALPAGVDIRNYGNAMSGAGVTARDMDKLQNSIVGAGRDTDGHLDSLAGYAAGTLAASKAIPVKLDALHRDFLEQRHVLERSTDPAKIANAARHFAADVLKGAGSTEHTKEGLAALRRQLSNTHDPGLQAVLRAAIAQVAGKLPNREWVDRQLAAAHKIEQGTLSTREKLAAELRIQQALIKAGDATAAHKLDSVISTDRSILAKKRDISVTVKPNPVSLKLDTREVATALVPYSHIFVRAV
jgi:TP901 family phage tail tape measure protein